MNIIEAIKSGKRFKRPGDEKWHPNSQNAAKRFNIETCMIAKNYCDIIADDWEVEIQKVELTRSDIENAFCRTQWRVTDPPFLDRFLKELGFK